MNDHPGRILELRFMMPLGINANRLAKALGVNRSTIGRLIDGRQRMTVEMAARLGAYFGVPSRWWLEMQAEHDALFIEQHPDLAGSVRPMEADPNVMITPKGVIRFDEVAPETDRPPIALAVADVEKLPTTSGTGQRKVRTVRYASGSLALVGDEG